MADEPIESKPPVQEGGELTYYEGTRSFFCYRKAEDPTQRDNLPTFHASDSRGFLNCCLELNKPSKDGEKYIAFRGGTFVRNLNNRKLDWYSKANEVEMIKFFGTGTRSEETKHVVDIRLNSGDDLHYWAKATINIDPLTDQAERFSGKLYRIDPLPRQQQRLNKDNNDSVLQISFCFTRPKSITCSGDRQVEEVTLCNSREEYYNHAKSTKPGTEATDP